MYNPVLHKDRMLSPSSHHTRSLPRPQSSSSASPWGSPSLSLSRGKPRSRSKSPAARSQLSLVICPDFNEFPEGMREYSNPSSPLASPRPRSPMPGGPGGRLKGQFVFSNTLSSPRPHALARTRGTEVLRDSASLPCSPVFARLGAGGARNLNRELSLPSSPSLPRIHIQDCEPKLKLSEVGLTLTSLTALRSVVWSKNWMCNEYCWEHLY